MRSETGTGAYRGGGTAMIGYANFAMGYSPVTSTGGGGSGSYTVREGETLSSIAANLWGDPALWYKLAEANGMTAAAALAEGQTLIVPAGVNRNQYNASTFRPYEAGDAMGDLSPTTPKPPRKNNCGVMGQVMMSVVAIAVTAVLPQVSGFFATVGGNILGGILSSAASQGFGLAAGIQDRFDWKSVAMAGGTAAVSAGLNGAGGFARIGIKGPGFGIQAAQGAIVAGVSQGIGVATGLQSKFDFAGIAAAGLGQGSGTFIGGKGIGRRLARIGTDELVSAASRSVITGTSFGDNLIAVLPSVIGRAIGETLEEGIRNASRQARPAETMLSDVPLSISGPSFGPLDDLELSAPLPLGPEINLSEARTEREVVASGVARRRAGPRSAAGGEQAETTDAESTRLSPVSPRDREIAGFRFTPNAAPLNEIIAANRGNRRAMRRIEELLIGYAGRDADSTQDGLFRILVHQLPASTDSWWQSHNYSQLAMVSDIAYEVSQRHTDGAYLTDDIALIDAELHVRAPLGYLDLPLGEDVVTTTVATAGVGVVSSVVRSGTRAMIRGTIDGIGTADGAAAPAPAIAEAVEGTSTGLPRWVFRGDDRLETEIFRDGFAPRGSSTDLLAHALDNAYPPSAYVPTSRSFDIAMEFGDNVYVIRPLNGIDVNQMLGASSPHARELEIAIRGGVQTSNIRAVTRPGEGLSILNPNYWPPR